jgi:hypothetical protein
MRQFYNPRLTQLQAPASDDNDIQQIGSTAGQLPRRHDPNSSRELAGLTTAMTVPDPTACLTDRPPRAGQPNSNARCLPARRLAAAGRRLALAHRGSRHPRTSKDPLVLVLPSRPPHWRERDSSRPSSIPARVRARARQGFASARRSLRDGCASTTRRSPRYDLPQRILVRGRLSSR